MGGQQAVSGGIFPIGHHKVDALFLFQTPQPPVQEVHTALACYIAHGQHLKKHGSPLRFTF